MIQLFIRKSFFDLWDNLFVLVLFNAGLLLSAAVPLIPLLFITTPGWLAAVLVAVSFSAACVWLAAVTAAVAEAAPGERLSLRQAFVSLPQALVPGLTLAGLASGLALSLGAVVPHYLAVRDVFSLVMLGLLGWFTLFCLLVGQYYLPLFTYARTRGYSTALPAIMKRCLLFFMDNSGFSLFLLGHSIVCLVVSALPAFLIPGPAGVLLNLADALYLRLFKYQWLESLPAGALPKPVPWAILLADERARLGERSLKSLIFPWKN